MLRQSMIAAAFAFATVTAAGHSDAAPAFAQTANAPTANAQTQNFVVPAASSNAPTAAVQTADTPIFAAPADASNAPHIAAAPQAHRPAPVHYRTIVHHVYRYEPAPAGYYYGPAYAPAPVAALPAAAACLALSLFGGC